MDTPSALPQGTRRSFWLQTPDGPRASWLHLPHPSRARSAGVVVCAPVGLEYTHSYRTLLRLADRLAGIGLVTLRFDYRACGSSPGRPLDDDLVEAWIRDVAAATTFLEGVIGGPPSLVGLRLGAALGAAACARVAIENYVAWAPVTRGRHYARELRALAAAGGTPWEPDANVMETAGLVLSRDTLADLKDIDVGGLTYRLHGSALVIEEDDLPASGAGTLVDALRRQNVTTESIVASGYLAMMEKPHSSVVPERTVDTIGEWLDARSGRSGLSPGLEEPTRLSASAVVTASATEELLHIPGRPPMFGVLTTPRGRRAESRPTLLLTNAGSAHNVGPNRLYVELARSLAAAGIATLRMDLSNLGDSIRGSSLAENHPYPPTAAADLARAMDWLRIERGVDRFVAGGLCSGAYTAFVCAQDRGLRGLEGVLMINPLTFEWTPGDSILTPGEARYHGSVRNPKRWKKLLSGAYDARDIFRFVRRALHDRMRDLLAGGLERLGFLGPRRLGGELLRIAQAGRRIDFVFSRFDPGHGLLMARARATVKSLERGGLLSIAFVNGADHSFSAADRRRELVRTIAARMIQYPAIVHGRGAKTPTDIEEGVVHVANH